MIQYLQPNHVLRLKGNQFFIEEGTVRKSMHFLIRFITRNQYNENRILSKLLTTAQKTADVALKTQYMMWSQQLLKRAKRENPLRRLISPLLRWLKGMPIIPIGQFATHLKKIQKMTPAAKPNALNGENQKYTHEKTRALLYEALYECPEDLPHHKQLQKWILVFENRKTIIKEYQDAVKQKGKGDWFNDRFSGYIFHGEYQDPVPVLKCASEFYAMAYESVRNDPQGKNDFFTLVFSQFNGCYEGNYSSLQIWYESRCHKNQDLIPQFQKGMKKIPALGEMHRVFNAYQFREYFNLYHEAEGKYDENNKMHQKIYNHYHVNPNPFMKEFKDSVDNKAHLKDFILKMEWVPRNCDDAQLTTENLQEELNQYFSIVFDEEN